MTSAFVIFALLQGTREFCNNLTIIKCFRKRLRFSPIVTFLCYASLFIAELSLCHYQGHNPTPMQLYSFGLARLAVSCVVLKMGIAAAFFIALFTSCFYAILYNFVIVLPGFLAPPEAIHYISIPLIILNQVIAIGFFFYFCKYYGEFLCNKSENKLLLLANIVTVFSLAAIASQAGWNKVFDIQHLITRTLILTPALLFMSAIILLIKEADTNNKLLANLNNLTKLHESEKNYFDSVLANKTETLNFRKHIQKESLGMIKLLDEQQYAKLKLIFDNLIQSSDKLSHVNLCGHQIIDAVVGYWQLQAWEKNIIFKTDLAIDNININDMDLAIVLGNALENAYAAAGNVKDSKPIIQVKIVCKAQLLLIDISNSFEDQILIKDNLYYSAKRNYSVPGTGIANIQLIVEKYNGFIDIEHDEKLFKLNIALAN